VKLSKELCAVKIGDEGHRYVVDGIVVTKFVLGKRRRRPKRSGSEDTEQQRRFGERDVDRSGRDGRGKG
jgi:hypothetical protein